MKQMKSLMSILVFVLLGSSCLAKTNVATDSFAVRGFYYLEEYGKDYNPAKAFDMFTKSAALGNARSMNAIAMLYQQGLGVGKSEQQALAWFSKAGNAGYTKAWYNMGMLYKDKLDYANAYLYIDKAATIGDPQSIYSKGYMLYKGFGCQQDYRQAVKFFKQSADSGQARSMRFLGLCYRNGYGVAVNIDSAKYWLLEAKANGDTKAIDELMAKEPEHKHVAGKELADKIKAAEAINTMHNTAKVNVYQKIEHSMQASEIAGSYAGYLLKYDWSGQYVIEANKLYVTLTVDHDTVKGNWLEDDTIGLPLRAYATQSGLVFDSVAYSKTNHYYPINAEKLVFEKAAIKIIKTDTGVYLAGNIQQYRAEVNEPAKPVYLALTRTSSSKENSILNLLNNDGTLITSSPIHAYPNPFGNSLTIDFNLKQGSTVTTQLLTIDGKVVYSSPTTTLTAGDYTLPIQVGQIPLGYYIVKLRCGNTVRTAKVVKL